MRAFLGKCLKKALHPSFSLAEKIGSAAAIFIPLIIKCVPKEQGDAMQELIWQIPLAIFASMSLLRLIVAPFLVYKDLLREKDELSEKASNLEKDNEEIKRKQFAIPDELNASYLKGLNIRIVDLAREDVIIRNRVFENCYIYGPALLGFLKNNHFNGCNFEGAIESTFIDVNENRTIIGAIGIEGCTFIGCKFRRIGFIGPSSIKEIMKKGIIQKEKQPPQ